MGTAAIDSSWNFTPYQGFYLFAVEGVAIRFDGTFLTEPLFETGFGLLKVEEGFGLILDPRLELQSRGIEYEYKLAKACIGKADLVLIDGSVLARFHDCRKKRPVKFYEYAEDLTNEESLVFVA